MEGEGLLAVNIVDAPLSFLTYSVPPPPKVSMRSGPLAVFQALAEILCSSALLALLSSLWCCRLCDTLVILFLLFNSLTFSEEMIYLRLLLLFWIPIL